MSGSVKDIDRGWKKIKAELKKADGAFVKVGVLSDAGQYEQGKKANLADVATWNEFGTSRIPARPFMKQSFDKNQAELKAMLDEEGGKITTGLNSAKQALDRIGVFFTGKVKEIFRSGSFLPNAKFTILKKNAGVIAKSQGTIKRLEKKKKLTDKDSAKLADAKRIATTGGKSTPLIDTGRLRNSINYEVELAGGGGKGKG